MTALTLPRFTRAEILFSLKSFLAAMLALYVASRAGLPRPFWAVLTTYVVSTNQTNLFSAQLTLVQAQYSELASLVQLYNALGGGWQQ